MFDEDNIVEVAGVNMVVFTIGFICTFAYRKCSSQYWRVLDFTCLRCFCAFFK